MKRNVVREVSALLAASLAALFLIFGIAPAIAGDRALFNFIGYSEDGIYAAYEEFGEWDGVGGYYSHIYIVDLSVDTWVKGSPYLVDPEDPPGDDDTDPRSIGEVRAKALELALPQLKALKIDVPAQTLFLLGDGQGDARGKFVTWSTPSYMGTGETQNDVTTLTIAITGGALSDECGDDGYASGFVLDRYDRDGKHTIHDDADNPIPKSRGCTIDYSIYAVLTPMDGGTPVAIISVYSSAMEGPDRRFMLVPLDKEIVSDEEDDSDDADDNEGDDQG